MPDTDAAARSFLAGIGLNLRTIVQFASICAIIYAQWTLLDKQVTDVEHAASTLATRVDALATRLYVAERDLATMTVRWENLRDSLIELRRQGTLRRQGSITTDAPVSLGAATPE